MPRIGLLSDSHGRAETTQRAVDLLLSHDIDLLLHLGDVGTVEVIDALMAMRPDGNGQLAVRLVFGNTDWDRLSLESYARELGIEVDHPVGRLSVSNGQGDVQLVYAHGDDPQPLDQAVEQGVKYVCHGHTHRFRDEKSGITRIINPGALFRANEYTVAILDTQKDELERWTVK